MNKDARIAFVFKHIVIKKIEICSLIALVIMTSCAQNDKNLDKLQSNQANSVLIKDECLYQTICKELNKTELTLSDLETVEELRINGNVKDLSGVRYLKNLKYLALSHIKKTTDLTELSMLTSLEEVSIWKSKFEKIDFMAGLVNLRRLTILHSRVTDITPLANLTKLERLWCRNNRIEDVSPIQNLTNLVDIDFSSNRISKLPDLSKLTKLSFRSFSYNRFKRFSFIEYNGYQDVVITEEEFNSIKEEIFRREKEKHAISKKRLNNVLSGNVKLDRVFLLFNEKDIEYIAKKLHEILDDNDRELNSLEYYLRTEKITRVQTRKGEESLFYLYGYAYKSYEDKISLIIKKDGEEKLFVNIANGSLILERSKI